MGEKQQRTMTSKGIDFSIHRLHRMSPCSLDLFLGDQLSIQRTRKTCEKEITRPVDSIHDIFDNA